MSEEISLVEAYKQYEDDRELDYQDDEVILIMNKNKEMTHLNEFEHIKPRCKLFAALESLRIEAIIYEPKENYFSFVNEPTQKLSPADRKTVCDKLNLEKGNIFDAFDKYCDDVEWDDEPYEILQKIYDGEGTISLAELDKMIQPRIKLFTILGWWRINGDIYEPRRGIFATITADDSEEGYKELEKEAIGILDKANPKRK